MKDHEFRVVNKPIYFSTFEDAKKYAMMHPGESITRNNKDVIVDNEDLTPGRILTHLNRFIISQDRAKKEISTLLYYHNLRSKIQKNRSIQSNGPIMIIGPTGSGKTFIVQKACEIINTLYIHVDASSMVSEGIIGYNIGKLAADILKKANFDIKKAEYCVIFFDEVDKLFKNNGSEYGEDVANQLLRLLEGTELYVHSKDIEQEESIKLSTHNMQFILGGAFQWIIDEKNKIKSNSLGFATDKNLQKEETEITMQDLYNENIPKELLGRMHTIVNISKLSEDDFYKILTESEKSPLYEFISKIEFHNDLVEISDATIRAIAHTASKSNLGVRGLIQILKDIFSDALFLAPNPGRKKHIITYKI